MVTPPLGSAMVAAQLPTPLSMTTLWVKPVLLFQVTLPPVRMVTGEGLKPVKLTAETFAVSGGVGVIVGVGLFVAVEVGVEVGVTVGLLEGVEVGVFVGVLVGVELGVFVAV